MVKSLARMLRYVAALGLVICLPVMAQEQLEVLYYDLADPFIATLKTYIDKAAEHYQINISSHDGQHQASQQLQQIEKAMQSGNPLLLNLVETFEVGDILSDAKKRQNRVVLFNRMPNLDFFSEYDDSWYVGSDERTSGKLQAEVIYSYLKAHPEADKNHNGKHSVLLLKGEAHNPDAEQRSVGVIQNLYREHVKLEIFDAIYCDWSEEKAYKAMQDFFTIYTPEDLDLIICNNDAMALGAIKALNRLGYNLGHDCQKLVPVFGIDGMEAGAKAVAEGRMQGTIKQDLETIATYLIRLGSSKVDGEKLAEEMGLKYERHYIYVPYKLLSKE
ncbi:MAG: substrate-binding domain-containing protein [Succinivibrio sp.]|nr:substrate-binding domain-containing protein [Succinivibrio sp.]